MFYDIKRKILTKYPKFGSEIAKANIEFKNCYTAATDGKTIYIDPNYFASLSENDKLFLVAHEIMHIKFMHMFRLKDKDGKARNPKLWNIATDAIINANLERDGFTIKEGYVNMPEALNYSAEEFYQILLKEQEKKQKQQQKQNEEQQEQNGDNNTSQQGDDHSLWKEAFKNKEQEKNQSKKEQKNKKDSKEKQTSEEQQLAEDQKSVEEQEFEFNEKMNFTENREEKREKFKERCEKIEQEIRGKTEETIKLDNIGESKEEIDWKVLIRREVEKTETIWSKRRAIAENNYAYRLEENDIEDEAETEIMIDVSGSVELDLVKAFLRQIKPLLKQSKLKVGCFNEKFWGLVDIKNVRDIDNFTIPSDARGHSAWTEDWDLAVRSFTKKREINKIVFTDGYPCPGTMPKDDLKNENIIWLVYGNKAFNPCCGKVINITERQLEKLKLINKNLSKRDMDR